MDDFLGIFNNIFSIVVRHAQHFHQPNHPFVPHSQYLALPQPPQIQLEYEQNSQRSKETRGKNKNIII